MSGQNSFKTFNPLKNTFNTEIYYADAAEDLKNKIELAAAAADILSKTSWIEISTFLQEIKAQLISRKASISKIRVINNLPLDERSMVVRGIRVYSVRYQITEYSIGSAYFKKLNSIFNNTLIVE